MSARYTALSYSMSGSTEKNSWAVTLKWAFFLILFQLMNQKIILASETLPRPSFLNGFPMDITGQAISSSSCGKEELDAHSDVSFNAPLMLFSFNSQQHNLFCRPWCHKLKQLVCPFRKNIKCQCSPCMDGMVFSYIHNESSFILKRITGCSTDVSENNWWCILLWIQD